MRKLAAAVLLIAVAGTACSRVSQHREPTCRPDSTTTLLAQSVETASLIPCVRSLPAGWGYGLFEVDERTAAFRIETRTGTSASVDVELLELCGEPVGEPTSDPDEPGTTVERTVEQDDPYRATWTYRFSGGCVQYRIALAGAVRPTDLLDELERGLSFLHRGRLSSLLERQGAPPVNEPQVIAS